jgi:hypothetical protein
MLKLISILFCFLLIQPVNAQRKVSSYFSLQYNKTVSDITYGNNPSGIGLGLETFINTKSKFKPVADISVIVFLEDDKVQRLTGNGEPIEDVSGMINVLAGTAFKPNQKIFISFVAGPSFINEATLLAIEPSIGLYFPKSQRWIFKMSYLNIFNRDKQTKKDFGSMGLAIAIKLF